MALCKFVRMLINNMIQKLFMFYRDMSEKSTLICRHDVITQDYCLQAITVITAGRTG